MAKPTDKISVTEFEKQVYQVESVRLVVRAPSNTAIKPYQYEKAASSKWRYSQLETRIEKSTAHFEYVIIDGYGKIPSRNMTLARIRKSYHTA